MRQFNEFIQDFELIDLPLVGASYTWNNHQEHNVSSRSDLFLFSLDWLEHDTMSLDFLEKIFHPLLYALESIA